MCFLLQSAILASLLIKFPSGKTILCDVIRHLSRVFETYHRQSKFGSVLHKENDDVLYGISAINVEFSLIEIREIHSPDWEIGGFD